MGDIIQIPRIVPTITGFVAEINDIALHFFIEKNCIKRMHYFHNGSSQCDYNPLEFRRIYKEIENRAILRLEDSRLGSIPYSKALKWLEEKHFRFLRYKVYGQWLRLLSMMEPEVLDFARYIFHCNFRNPCSGNFLLEDYNAIHPVTREEILDYKPLCQLVAARGSLDYDGDWQKEFAEKPDKNIDETLKNCPANIGLNTLRGLKEVELKRPLNSKLEIVTTIVGSNCSNVDAHLNATTKEIKAAKKLVIKTMKKHINVQNISAPFSLRSANGIYNFSQYVDKYAKSNTFFDLTDKTLTVRLKKGLL